MRDFCSVDFSDLAGRHVLIALSGGADSTALAHMLARSRGKLALRLSALHVHHGLRGDDADADERFCARLCEGLDIAYECARIDVREAAVERGEGIETAARRLRYGALDACADRIGADAIALAHHMDDQAETVLMHLMRGSGLEGVQGMRRWSGRYVRPMLCLRHAQICDWLRGEGLPWREDLTNLVPDNPRNALRLNVIGEMERIQPGCVRAIARFARLAGVDNAYLERETDRFLKTCCEGGPYGIRIAASEKAEVAILSRALLRICGEADAARVCAAADLAKASRGRTQVSGRWDAEKAGGHLYLIEKPVYRPDPVLIDPHGRVTLARVGTLACVPSPAVPVRNDPFVQVLGAHALEGCVLRTRLEGDRIAPLGLGGTRLLSDVLTDRKIDRPLRDHIPLIARGRDIIWAVGIAIADAAKITGDTREAIRLRWTPAVYPPVCPENPAARRRGEE